MDNTTKTLTQYEKEFGAIPDSRLMSSFAMENLVALCSEAIARGSALTDEEIGLALDVPEGVTI